MIRPIRIEGDIAYVPLTQGYEAVIDAADVPLVAGLSWYTYRHKRAIYAVTNSTDGDGRRFTLRMHSAITGFAFTDHRDGNGLNNRRSNLRPADRQQNNRNARLRVDNACGLKGAYWHKGVRKFAAHIRSSGRPVHLGYFDTAEAAHAAYCEASALIHGEFGRTA